MDRKAGCLPEADLGPIEEDMVEWKLTDCIEDFYELYGDIVVFWSRGADGARILRGKWERTLQEWVIFFSRGVREPRSLCEKVLTHLTDVRALIARNQNDPSLMPSDEDYRIAIDHMRELVALTPPKKLPPTALRA